MIRYPVTQAELEAWVERESPGWIKKAKRNPSKGIWNKVRRVYSELQQGKCAYCERLLSDAEKVKEAHGRPLDHFRPRSLYPELAHEVLNYAAACVDCNSALKKDLFPVDEQQRPLLIYPIGGVDADPESLITFHGFVAMTAKKKGYARRRALTTLELFRTGPDGLTRSELLKERAYQICLIWHTRKGDLERYLKPSQPHANCCRNFVRLLRTNQPEARRMFERADSYLESVHYPRPTNSPLT